MAKRTERSITKVGGVDPSYLTRFQEDTSLDSTKDFVVLPRLKIIQGMTEKSVKDQFGEGSCILRPGDTLVVNDQESFLFVPQLFFPEWCKWADRRDNDSNPILERSYDASSEIALRAKDPERRTEVYEGQSGKDNPMKYRWVEHLNFAGVIYGDHPLAGTALTISLSKGEHSSGMNWIQAIRMRRVEVDGEPSRVPLWAQVWELRPAFREKGDRQWWGLNYASPETPLISPDEADVYQSQHQELAELHAKRRLVTDLGENEEEDAESDKF